MKNTKDTFLSIGLALLLLTVVPGLQHGVYGQEELVERGNNAIHNRIVGLWDVQVTVRNCSTEAPLAAFNAMHAYQLGGTGQVVPATNPAVLSAHLAVWEHVYRDDYTMAFKMFRFDSAGTNIGWTEVRNTVNIADGVYTGSGVAVLYNNAGDMVGMSCPTFEGVRFQ